MEQVLGLVGDIKLDNVNLSDAIRTLHQKSLSTKTLENLCLEYSANNVHQMIDWHESFNLPNSLKNKLLSYYTKSFNSRTIPLHSNWSALSRLISRLLNNETKELDFSKWVSFSVWTEDRVSKIIELLRLARYKAPNLERLSVYCYAAEEYEILQQIMDEIMLFKNLKHLEVGGFCWLQNEELIKIPLMLPNLVCLKLQLDNNITLDAFVNFPLLQDLQQFYFWMDDGYCLDDVVELNEIIYSWCAENLPHLKLIGGTTDINSDMNINIFQVSPQFAGTSNLEYLHASHELPNGELPNLKHLFLKSPFLGCPVRFLSKIRSYEKLTHLTLDAPDFYPILRAIGQQLISLHFGAGIDRTIDYYEILFLCPNLKKLFQCGGSPCILESPFQHRIKTPTTLEDVALQLYKRQSSKGLLKTIFQSPEIKNVRLRGFFIGSDDIIKQDELPKGLPSLQSLVLDDLQLSDDCRMGMFADMMTQLIFLAPCLKCVTVRWTWDTDLLAEWNCLTDVNEYIAIVNSKSPPTNFEAADETL